VRNGLFLGIACVLISSGCAQRALHDVPEEPNALAECAAEPRASLSTSALPLKMPANIQATSPHEAGERLARRVVVTFAPGNLIRGDTLLWTHLTIRTLGGTVDGWLQFQSGKLRMEAATAKPRRRSPPEHVNIELGPGYFDVSRSAAYGTNLANDVLVDLLLRPGGIPIDESVLRVNELWSAKGKPLPADAVHVGLEPIRHVPGFDTIEAEIKLEYVIARAGEPNACRGLAQQRIVLATRDAVRPPLWDVGTSSMNSGRTRWLALSSPASGVFRAIFDSPTAASSFANWVRTTQATQIGPYQIGLVQQYGRQPLRPLVPVDRGTQETFQPLEPKDLKDLRPGPLGEP
jgi:hypothetical protein